MCLVCAEWQKGKLTFKEAWRNMGEMLADDPHLMEVADMLVREAAEKESKDSDSS